MTKAYEDINYTAPDGLSLYARDYGSSDKPPILCMHGLTRNSADFHQLALSLKEHYRLISVDQRGRGLSDYDSNPQNYRPDIYCADMFALLEHLNLNEIMTVGTSMGGLMTMMMAAAKPRLIKAAIINDIGPEIDATGLARIKNYIGGAQNFENWDEAVAALKAQGPDVFPDYTETDWYAFARRTCCETAKGRIKFAYDPTLSQPFNTDDTAAAPPNLWPIFEALASSPLLIIRGANSDILSADTAAEMKARHPNCRLAEIPRIGHAPMLDEPESLAAINEFLESLK